MDITLCSFCLLIVSAVRKTNSQNLVNTPVIKHGEEGLPNAIHLEPKAAPLFSESKLFTHPENRSAIAYKHRKDKFLHRLASEQINVTCSHSKLRVEVRKDFWSSDSPRLTSADLSLGETCDSNEDTADTIVFNYGLNSCGTKRSVGLRCWYSYEKQFSRCK